MKAPQHRGTPDSDELSFSNSEPSFDWPSSYLGADARLARLGRDAMVLGLRAGARTAAKPRGRQQRLFRHVRARFTTDSRGRSRVGDTGTRGGRFFILEDCERVYPAKARERALSRF